METLDYEDDERGLTIFVEYDRGELLGVVAYDANDDEVDLSDDEESDWIQRASEDLMDRIYDAADAMVNARRERDL